MKSYAVRLVQDEDIERILEIYKPYIEDTVITFETEVPDIHIFRDRIRRISAEYPYIVYLNKGKIVGYAYAHRHMERAAYQWNAELSIYVDQEYLHCGIGKTLYKVLIEILKLQNVYNVYGCVAIPNLESEKLHESFGFHKLGVYHNTGYKNGAWQDVAWFEKTINQLKLDPASFISIQEIELQKILKLLNEI